MTLADFPALAALSNEEKLLIADELYVAIGAPGSPPLTDEQLAELNRRHAEHLADPGSALSWDQVKASAMAAVRDVEQERAANGEA